MGARTSFPTRTAANLLHPPLCTEDSVGCTSYLSLEMRSQSIPVGLPAPHLTAHREDGRPLPALGAACAVLGGPGPEPTLSHAPACQQRKALAVSVPLFPSCSSNEYNKSAKVMELLRNLDKIITQVSRHNA